MTTNTPKPPPHLSKEAAAWWSDVCTDYPLEDAAGRMLLTVALESFDRLREAQARVTADGAFVQDRHGQIKPHPALDVERQARAHLLQSWRQLGFEIEVVHRKAGRPSTRA